MKELNNYQDIKSFIRNFIIEDENLFKVIYYSDTSALQKDLPDNPYEIFTPSSSHGCVLFRRKNDVVLSEEGTNVLITMYNVPYGNFRNYSSTLIDISIICKGVNVQELDDSTDRSAYISYLIDINFNQAMINGSLIKRESYKPIPLNEENSGFKAIYSTVDFSYDYLNNKNIQKQIRGEI